MAGVNAGVVGILVSAWVDPVYTRAIRAPADVGLALGSFRLLVWAGIPPVVVVAVSALGGWAISML